MKAIRVPAPGGPEVLTLREEDPPQPGSGEAVVRLRAIGVNFIDVYHRTGLYPLPLPFTPGMEAAGVVDSIGEGVERLEVGERVGYVMVPGAYAELAAVPAERLVPLPEKVSFSQAAGVLLQGMTAQYLSHTTFPLEAGHRALVHAAAGGVGQLLVQMAKRRGAFVFGTVSTEEKAEAARRAGADVVIRYTEEDFEAVVRRETGGEGLHVVYDSVGRTTFDKSLACLRPRGMLALYGQSSGPVPPFDPALLGKKGSLFLTRPSLAHYALDRAELRYRAAQVLEAVAEGSLQIQVDREMPLAEAPEAHRLLEGRKTSGKLLLVP